MGNLKTVTTLQAAEFNAKINFLTNTVEDATTTKSSKIEAVNITANDFDKIDIEKYSLAKSEKNVLEILAKLIDENTVQITSLFKKQLLHVIFTEREALKKANRVKDAKILTKMVQNFGQLSSGTNFVEFKKNVKELRENCTILYSQQLDHKKAIKDEIKALQQQITALQTICETDEDLRDILSIKVESIQQRIIEMQTQLID